MKGERTRESAACRKAIESGKKPREKKQSGGVGRDSVSGASLFFFLLPFFSLLQTPPPHSPLFSLSNQQLRDLHRVQRRALLDLVPAHEEVETLFVRARDVPAVSFFKFFF